VSPLSGVTTTIPDRSARRTLDDADTVRLVGPEQGLAMIDFVDEPCPMEITTFG